MGEDVTKANKPYPNRIEVFHYLTYDEVAQSLNMNLFGNILDNFYDDFVAFCEDVKRNATELTRLSCYIENDQIHFVIDQK